MQHSGFTQVISNVYYIPKLNKNILNKGIPQYKELFVMI